MSVPTDLMYTTEHEWVLLEETGEARCGVTAYAADALGEVVFLDLPSIGDTVSAGDPCGEIESTKSVSELFAPVTGEVTAINNEAIEAPEVVNTDPYGAGWLFVITPSESPETLLEPGAYEALIAKEKEQD